MANKPEIDLLPAFIKGEILELCALVLRVNMETEYSAYMEIWAKSCWVYVKLNDEIVYQSLDDLIHYGHEAANLPKSIAKAAKHIEYLKGLL